jgi:F-box/leucine-rich repeat protein 14
LFNYFTPAGLHALTFLKGLKHLKLSGGGPLTDTDLKTLSALTELTYLELSDAQSSAIESHSVSFTDKGLEHLKVLKLLTSLYLGGNNTFTDNGLKHLKVLKLLRYLILCDKKNRDKTIDDLRDLND